MTPTPTPTSGAADLRTAAQAVVDRWDTPLWKDVPATAEYIGRLRAALAAGQATAAKQGAYAALSESFLEIPDVQDESGINAYYSREVVLECIDAALASHGQAPAGATKPTEQQILEAAEKAGLWPNTVHSWIPAFHRYHKELAKAQSAPARADSVQEDAARYRLLRRGQHWSVIDGTGNDLRAEALDAAVDEARKQGATT